MVENNQVPMKRNSVGAAVLSAIFPGVGFFYLGNVIKGIAYLFIFIALLVMLIESRGLNPVVFSLLLAGFYIFQIFDCYNEAEKLNYRKTSKTKSGENGEEKISLFASVSILVIGVIFQLAQFDIVRIREVIKLWPLLLIVLGGKYIYTYTQSNKNQEQELNSSTDHEELGGNDE